MVVGLNCISLYMVDLDVLFLKTPYIATKTYAPQNSFGN